MRRDDFVGGHAGAVVTLRVRLDQHVAFCNRRRERQWLDVRIPDKDDTAIFNVMPQNLLHVERRRRVRLHVGDFDPETLCDDVLGDICCAGPCSCASIPTTRLRFGARQMQESPVKSFDPLAFLVSRRIGSRVIDCISKGSIALFMHSTSRYVASTPADSSAKMRSATCLM